jgi:hypothetical protein
VTHEEIIALLSDWFDVDPDGIRYIDGEYKIDSDGDDGPEVALCPGWGIELRWGILEIRVDTEDNAASVTEVIQRAKAACDAFNAWNPEGVKP